MVKSISRIKLNIVKKLKENKKYRKSFFRRRTQTEIAMRIRELRKTRKMRQIDLAKESDMLQSAISRIEQSEYSSWSLTTLFRVAEALNTRLRVIFEPIEDVIKQYEEKERDIYIGSQQFIKLNPPIAVLNKALISDKLPEITHKFIERDKERNFSIKS
jgi:transcriptional regulator with XRE-family HTH domain